MKIKLKKRHWKMLRKFIGVTCIDDYKNVLELSGNEEHLSDVNNAMTALHLELREHFSPFPRKDPQ